MKRPRRSSYSDFLNSYSLGSGSASWQTGGTLSAAGSVARKGGAGRSTANTTASRVVTRTRENAARRDLIRASSKGPAPTDLRANWKTEWYHGGKTAALAGRPPALRDSQAEVTCETRGGL